MDVIIKNISEYKIHLKSLVLLLGILLSVGEIQATHIVGGDLTYRCLGNNYYEFTLTVRRDCRYGKEPFDSKAILGFFFGDDQPAYNVGVTGVIEMDFFGIS